jgi:DNA-binding response OmpR family regulator
LVEKVTGLKIGGDDYLTKPFQIEELVARVEALLRRAGHAAKEVPHTIETKDIVLDEDKHECTVAGDPVVLWPKEYELLKIFLQQPGRLLSREYLSEHVWALTYFETTHTIDTTVQRLRKKLGACGKMIETVRGYGYRFNEK